MNKDIKDMLDYYNKYVSRYTVRLANDSKEIFLKDMLYGLGLSFSKEYRFSSGFDRFLNEKIKPLVQVQNNKEPIKVVRAAIVGPLGGVFSVPQPGRHNDIIRLMRNEGWDGVIQQNQQGFLLSDGRFVNRKDALKIAIDANQVTKEILVAPNVGLFSEDVW